MLNKIVAWLSADWFVALCSLLGVLSFIASVYAALKARSIDKTLNKYKVQQQFKEDQDSLLQKLHGFVKVIENGDLSKGFIPDIVFTISTIKHCYPNILPIKTKARIFLLLQYLKKTYYKIKPEHLAYEISYLEGALSKKGE